MYKCGVFIVVVVVDVDKDIDVDDVVFAVFC